MRVDILKESGFCGGVNRALHLLDKTIRENPLKPIYLIGPIVHNSIVNKKYQEKGVKFITLKDVDKLEDDSIVVVSAHGLSDKDLEKLKNFNVINTTCPYVQKNKKTIHDSIGYDIIFIGKKGHSETNALTLDNPNIKIVEKLDDLNKFSSSSYGMVFNQTTFNIHDLRLIQDRIREIAPFYVINDTICPTSRALQEFLMEKYDYNICLIVGDKTSSNANSLYEISPYKNTYFISSAKDANSIYIKKTDNVLIVGSASTPKDELKKIKDSIKNRFNSK